MPYLIDGDNLLGTWPGRRRSDAERRRLAHELARWGARERRRVVTVFDGAPPATGPPAADVLFPERGKSADDVVLELLRRDTDPRQWVVVTSDRSLGDQCRYLGARVQRCDRFRPRLRRAVDDDKPERVDDLDFWLEQFDEPEA